MTKYYFRIDDVYSSMNWSNFTRLINLFDEYDIKVLLGVVPDWKLISFQGNDFLFQNKSNFFEIISDFIKSGHLISLHGHQHTILSNDSGLFGINNYSEFAGLSFEVQESKIIKGLEIFKKYNLKTNIFMPPAHSLDKNTLRVLKRHGFDYISDGLFLFPEKRFGMIYLPQVFGIPRKFPFGLTSFALHPNFMSNEDFKNLEIFLRENRTKIFNFGEFLDDLSQYSFFESYFYKFINLFFFNSIKIYKLFKR